MVCATSAGTPSPNKIGGQRATTDFVAAGQGVGASSGRTVCCARSANAHQPAARPERECLARTRQAAGAVLGLWFAVLPHAWQPQKMQRQKKLQETGKAKRAPRKNRLSGTTAGPNCERCGLPVSQAAAGSNEARCGRVRARAEWRPGSKLSEVLLGSGNRAHRLQNGGEGEYDDRSLD